MIVSTQPSYHPREWSKVIDYHNDYSDALQHGTLDSRTQEFKTRCEKLAIHYQHPYIDPVVQIPIEMMHVETLGNMKRELIMVFGGLDTQQWVKVHRRYSLLKGSLRLAYLESFVAREITQLSMCSLYLLRDLISEEQYNCLKTHTRYYFTTNYPLKFVIKF
ncbi:hypothetical protein SAMD00019534_125420 [Acytostelium subglobosum LB1]|uniref:hypothetical protein n=1 Tax=Acytostelium subglobosum LB1 TaxID=1410327 RepID=UPI00064510AB|nr:hypothetical protein SAMD00019534_125420 [Acytostelium subglobosum LB1]GAM29366.1 hypothetical protein SAMD00019534_125420 [Acytostelium subglobosum LB1]|eukprot:XP_012747671.1 hypothetical protein SAMD00019534_125420 [Acytostelium subglobosum LB1]